MSRTKNNLETNRLLHELQVHQEELEMQNNELRQSRQELEVSRERYFELFDMAPVGYLTLTGQGKILEANLTVASLLGVARGALLTKLLSTYIFPEDQDLFSLQRRQSAESLLPQQWEMRIVRPDGSFFWAELKATPTRNDECWIVLEDISRRKQAEDILHHQSRQMIHLILDNVPQRIFWKDRNSVYMGCNHCFAEDSGLADSLQIIGKTDYDLSWHERAEHYRKDDQLVMKADRPKLHYDESIKCADGSVLYITTSKVPLHDPHGSVIGVLCTYENITDRKLALEELSKNAEQYRAMLATNLFGFWLVDIDGKILDVNDTYCRMSGYTREELLQYSISDIESSESVEDTFQHIEQLMTYGTDHFESRHRAKEGRIYNVEISTTYLPSQAKFIVFIRDISDRKQAEAALLESKARYHAIVEDQTDLICRYRPDGRLSFVNNAYLRYFDKEREEMINRNFIPHIPQPDLSGTLEQLRGISHETPIVNVEHRVIMPDGSICWQQWVHRGIFTLDGVITEYQAVGRDITERKAAEEILHQAKAEAESANQAKSAFLYTMSHEIRTPLSALLGNIELLAASQLVPQQQDYLKDCKASSQMLLQVLNDVLDFSKIEAGKLEVTTEIFSISSMARQLVRIFSGGAGQKGLELTMSLADDLPVYISSDQHRLRQIISNLLSNAIKFTNNGTVSLKISSDKNLPSSKPDSVDLIFTVCDTGIGIPPEKLSSVFDSFTQVESFSTRRHAGTGLGLAICRRLVEIMGGIITLSSEPGKGSVFTVSLPVVVSKTPAQQVITRQIRAKTDSPRNILLADDEELGRTVTTALLQRRGHLVTEAANGTELLELLRQQSFDIVLSDISMPDMDGLEVARIIRSGELVGVDQQIPVIAMTAHAFQNEVESFLAAGFNAYAAKPVNFDELLNTIDELCIRHSRR